MKFIIKGRQLKLNILLLMMISPPISAAFVLQDEKVQLPARLSILYTIFYTLLVLKKQRFLFSQ
ncbi:MAG: hypothetical protein D3917_02325 [Candidatus Electrothrix sp. AX5]|nr:hypothetical protein [Candidatus Electrothrix sp. AX5]